MNPAEQEGNAIRGIFRAVWMGVILWAAIGAVAYFLTGCRTYYVYQFGDHPAINVDAKVDKDLSPTMKVSAQ